MNLVKQTIQQRIKYLVSVNRQAQNIKDLPTEELKLRMQTLLKHKKIQTMRQVKETHYLQILSSQKKFQEEEIKQFYTASKEIMSQYDRKFHNYIEKSDDFAINSVFLYMQFFKDQKCDYRAYEILNIYKKKLCSNSLLLPTLLSWFSEWTRKTFTSVLKSQLNIISSLLEEKDEPKISYNMKNSMSVDIVEQQKRPEIATSVSIAPSVSISPSVRLSTLNEEQKIFISKQMLIGSLVNEMHQLYKYHENVLDIDVNYIKSIKKNDKKKIIVNNLQKVVNNLCRILQTQQIKTINEYKLAYTSKFPEYLKQYNKMQNNKLHENNPSRISKRKKRKQKPMSKQYSMLINPQQNILFLPSKKVSKNNLRMLISNNQIDINIPTMKFLTDQKIITKSPTHSKDIKIQENLRHKSFSQQIQKSASLNISQPVTKQNQKHRYDSITSETQSKDTNKKEKVIQFRLEKILQLIHKPLPQKSDVFYLPKLRKYDQL